MFPTKLPSIPGSDVAGVVDQVGDAVAGVSVGDEVFGRAVNGAYAEYALLQLFVKKPESMPWKVAASLPAVGETAYRVLRELNVKSGETVLIHAAAGGVGSIAVQIARNLGATVKVAEKMNITEAAKALFISQPAVSKAVKNLEDNEEI
jgi:NADPH:quinone reductase-like Zn-dependent oxidoreductase